MKRVQLGATKVVSTHAAIRHRNPFLMTPHNASWPEDENRAGGLLVPSRMPGLIELSGGVRIWTAGDAGLVGVGGLAVGGLLEEVAVGHVAEPESGGRGWPVAGSWPFE